MTAIPYRITRLHTIMVPEPGDPLEVEGVLNPGTARGPDGNAVSFPRLVAAGNRSRIGQAEVLVERGVPVGVRRRRVVLAPDQGWERGTTHGGVEDPRITTIAALGLHVMAYVAFGPFGPRPAVAVSTDLAAWRRLGPVLYAFDEALGTDLNLFPNKDVVFFPEIVPAPDGTPSIAVLHRPMWDLGFPRPGEVAPVPTGVTDTRPSIWISYIPAEAARADPRALVLWSGHRCLAGPLYAWEAHRLGAGPPPLRVPEGWLVVHHGVSGDKAAGPTDGTYGVQTGVTYVAGALLLDAADPSRLIARTATPLFVPETDEERSGVVNNVVFPTAIEVFDGIAYVFYGMADARIGVARLDRIGD